LRSLYNVQALRAVAALMVMVGHGSATDMRATIPSVLVLTKWVSIGGVDIFFVISGFIIATVVARDPENGRLRSAGSFLFKRAARIYPVYWVVLFACLLITTCWHPIEPGKPDLPFVSYFFLFAPVNYYVPQAWTMGFEVYFYVVIAAIILLVGRRHFFQAVTIWMLVQSAFALMEPVWVFPSPLLTNPLVFEFGFGALIAFIVARGAKRHAILCLIAGVLCFAVAASLQATRGDPSDVRRLFTFGIGGALITYSAIALEVGGIAVAGKISKAFGDASYSIYVWHQGLLLVLSDLTFATYIPRHLSGWAILCCWLLICLLVSFASYRFLEKPIIRVASRLIGSHRNEAPIENSPVGAYATL